MVSLPLFILFSTLLFVLHRWRKRISRVVPLPPGPEKLPIIGNVYDIPHEQAWLTYTEWKKQFGDVIYMEIFGTSTVILNSVKATTEIFEKRSSNYADRPRMIMANELMGWGWDFAHMQYSDWWRRHRKTFHQYFQPRKLTDLEPIQKEATVTLLQQLYQSPQNYAQHIRQHAGSVILQVVYGYEAQTENDYYVALAKEAINGLVTAVHAGSYFVDYLPILKYVPNWLPGAHFKRQAKIWAKSTFAMRDTPFELVKRTIAAGTAIPSFVSRNIENMNSKGYDHSQEEVIKNCAGISYLAGSDTTVSVVQTWVLAMARNPHVQALAHAELDAVLGHSLTRLPDFNDRASLPYIEAMLSETLRWYPVTPLALPHRALKDDIYDGYYIPAGATVIGNAWAILHDEDLYPEPFHFKPERFLKTEGKSLPPDPASIGAFGFGRRICPGRYFALNTAWIVIVSILSCFDILKPLDSEGKEYDPPMEYTDGAVVHPKPFEVRLVPRSKEVNNLLRTAKEEYKSGST